MADDDDQRTFDPTPRRREDFRKQGRFAKARDAGGIAAMAAVIGALLGTRGAASQAVSMLFTITHGDLGAFSRGEATGVFWQAAGVLGALALPAAIAGALAAAVASMAQAGLRFETEQLGFKVENLNPLPRLQQLLSPTHAGFETLFAILRVGAVGFVAYTSVRDELADLLALGYGREVPTLSPLVGSLSRLTLKTLGVLVVLAAADYAHSRFKLEKEMKMTLQELKDEMRSNDGDPKVKARMRARAKALARRRAALDMKNAAVVITNPTHVAVALRYGAKDPAPVVIAKGHDEVALQIRADARKHGVPIIESRALARSLDAEVPIGRPIPGAHFAAVAKVLAFVYRLKGRRAAR